MVLTLAIILMAVARSCSSRAEGTLVRLPVRSRRVGLPVFGLAVALALVTIPSAAWASAPTSPVEEGTPVSERAGEITAKGTSAGAAPQASEYAAREAQAGGLEKFQGGDTTVIIGGSALVIIIIVVLILVLI